MKLYRMVMAVMVCTAATSWSMAHKLLGMRGAPKHIAQQLVRYVSTDAQSVQCSNTVSLERLIKEKQQELADKQNSCIKWVPAPTVAVFTSITAVGMLLPIVTFKYTHNAEFAGSLAMLEALSFCSGMFYMCAKEADIDKLQNDIKKMQHTLAKHKKSHIAQLQENAKERILDTK